MACDHASIGGIVGWDLAENALDFHDRHCITCTQRMPVRLPNLTLLLQRRNALMQRVDAEKQNRERKAAAQLAARKVERQSLRATLDHLSAAILDLVDRDRSRKFR